jgi:hypothetical protein
MFSRSKDVPTGTTTSVRGYEPLARGGVSAGPILTGVVVAFGAMLLLSALIGGIIAALELAEPSTIDGGAVEVGIGAGIALVVAQFLAYMWGGYTAGRMARGAGAANGFLVPLVAIIVGAIVAAVVTGLGAETNFNMPFSDYQLPIEENNLVDWGVGIGIAALVAMFLGGLIGGAAGARWHTKLEREAFEEHHEGGVVLERPEEVDLRERSASDRATDQTAVAPRDGVTRTVR